MKRRSGFLTGAAALGATLVLWLVSGGSLEAQSTSASVSGTVQDSQGGALLGATVTLTSRTQGSALTSATDERGRFVFPIVRPDKYSLQVGMPAFKTLDQANVVVSANDDFSAGILTLEVGEMTESISVLARVSELQGESGERSFTLEDEAIQNIANNGRSFFGFTTLVPGVAPLNGFENPDAAHAITVNGQRDSQNNVTIDGVANIDTGNNGGSMATTNLDAVSEFKILTNAYQAEYGRAVGGQIQVVTRSGTTEFHGSGYWYGRRSDWNANSWTNNRDGIEPAEASRNDHGYTIGGPIFIPGVFNQEKRKLFFFWSQEFQKRKDPVGERQARVPTALERQGDFSLSVDHNGNPWAYIRDYTTGLPCGPGDARGCFQDGGVLGRIPQDRLYEPGLNALSIYPEPNFAGASGINYRSQTPDNQPRREELLRIDVQPTDNWRFTGRYMRSEDFRELPYGVLGLGSPNLDDAATTFDHPGRNWLVSATGILDTTTSLEVSIGSARNSVEVAVANPRLTRSAAGLTGLPLLYPDAVQGDLVPTLSFNGGRVGNAGLYRTEFAPLMAENTTYDALANLTKVWGAHTAKFGVYYQSSWKAQSPFAAFNSGIRFVSDPNNPFDTGFGYANAATGLFWGYLQASTYAYPEWVYKNLEWYAQDNWKATSRLTLDYGVRFYYLTPQWDRTLAASTFLPDRFDFQNAARLYHPVCVGASPCSGEARRGMDPALVGSVPPTVDNTVDGRFIGRLTPDSDRFNGAFQAGQGVNDTMQSGNAFRVSPRFGFVYDLSGRYTTILRGGFGVFYDRPQGNMVFGQIDNAPGMLIPVLQWGRLQDLGAAGGDPDPTLNMNPTAYDFAPPKVYSWNVGLQHKLLSSLTLDIVYVGSSSKDLLSSERINAVPYGAKFLPENQDATRPPSATPGATALPDVFLRPYPGYSDMWMFNYKGYSNYHSLQTSLQRRFDNGFMFSVFYVWSKALGINDDDSASIRPNASNEEIRRADYSYVAHDRPHNFVVNFVYQTPRIAAGALGVIANDWQISGVYRWMSGTPYPVNFFIPGIGAENLTGSDFRQNARVVVICDPGRGSSSDPYRQIDTSCFAPPQTPSDGTESARYFVHGPGVNNLDLSISKAFALGSRFRLEVRLDMFNALNHTQWSGVNNTVAFASQDDPTILNLPYDGQGNLVRENGFGTIGGVRPPRTIQLVTRLTF